MKLFARSLFVKLLSAAGVGTLVMVAAGMYALLNALAGLESYQQLLDRQVAAERAVLHMQATFKEQVQEWKNVLIRGADPQALEKYWAQFQAREAEVQKSARELTGGLEGEPEARQLVERFAAAHRDMGQAYRRGFDAFKNSRFDTSVGDQAVKGIDREATDYLIRASEVIAASVQKSNEKVRDDSARAVRVGMTLVVITLLGAAFFFLWIVRRYVIGPTAIVMRELEALAAGDFSQPVTRHGEDEIGRLADSAEQIRIHLGKALAEVVQSAKQLAHAAERLADVSHVASEGVAAQQKEVELVATAINEMSSTVNEVARSAATAAEAAGNADQESRAGRETVSRTIDDIDRLAGEIESTAKAVAAVEGQSRNISSVIDVIRGIAEQTNLLALNAAIEAARAGEQGRGFAVVADEVRTLASRTHKSTQEIQELISQLQNGTHNAVEVMGRSRGLAGETVNQAAGARQALETITGAIGRINDMNTQIASASEEQGAVAEELNRNIIRINQVAEESAAGSQQIASASRELNTLARQLESLTGRFKLQPG